MAARATVLAWLQNPGVNHGAACPCTPLPTAKFTGFSYCWSLKLVAGEKRWQCSPPGLQSHTNTTVLPATLTSHCPATRGGSSGLQEALQSGFRPQSQINWIALLYTIVQLHHGVGSIKMSHRILLKFSKRSI